MDLSPDFCVSMTAASVSRGPRVYRSEFIHHSEWYTRLNRFVTIVAAIQCCCAVLLRSRVCVSCACVESGRRRFSNVFTHPSLPPVACSLPCMTASVQNGMYPSRQPASPSDLCAHAYRRVVCPRAVQRHPDRSHAKDDDVAFRSASVRLLPVCRDRCRRNEHLARCRGALLALPGL